MLANIEPTTAYFRYEETSEVSKDIFKIKEICYQELFRANYYDFREKFLIQNLNEIYVECQFENWDGYNAKPISIVTRDIAYNFINSLPYGFVRPDIGAEPDGAITLEWYKNPDKVISLSINPDGKLYYASINGSKKYHGEDWALFPISPELLELISKIIN